MEMSKKLSEAIENMPGSEEIKSGYYSLAEDSQLMFNLAMDLNPEDLKIFRKYLNAEIKELKNEETQKNN